MASSKLFGVYINGLFRVLKRSKIGCTIFVEYCGIHIFADDTQILTRSKVDGSSESLQEDLPYMSPGLVIKVVFKDSS